MKMSFGTSSSELQAKKAIVVYGTSDDQLCTAYQHPIVVTEQGTAALGPGQQVTEELIQAMQRLNKIKTEQLHLLPPEVIAMSGRRIAWTVAGRVRPMALKSSDRAIQAFDGVPLPQPHLLFIAGPGTLQVYALASSERPDANTPLYRAPYLNMFSSNQMCRGTVPLPYDPHLSKLKEYEDLFFLSNSTGGNVPLPSTVPTYRHLLELCQERGHFDPQWLVPTGQTLQSILTGDRQ